ncbi:dihydrofolate reductase family protein [Lewinella sp. IMCC34191]|uniref:dihydrofolate reductase family protein n=1 Tax=Lewinella sp. IMCC34191 TaxID=2259172 RepID=UPI000E270D70|nr:dihydrofolate reductase family protein [Lewinella sp. IMCC34191]
MTTTNSVFIATSLDGYIADRHGGIDWLHATPNPNGSDLGYGVFMSGSDALVMGRNTFETVCGFDGPWPYEQPVFVLSNRLLQIPPEYADKAKLVQGPLPEVLAQLHRLGHRSLYIDGGRTIQAFLREDLIDELIVTRLPILLGGGIPLFGDLPEHLDWTHVSTRVWLDALVQSHYRRVRKGVPRVC